MKNYLMAQLDEIEPTACSCGSTRRAFVGPNNTVATVHLLDISEKSRVHYHKRLTEVYVVIEGKGHLEMDGEIVAVGPMSAVLIKPGCRHRAIGDLRIVNIPVPAFDPEDVWFDE